MSRATRIDYSPRPGNSQKSFQERPWGSGSSQAIFLDVSERTPRVTSKTKQYKAYQTKSSTGQQAQTPAQPDSKRAKPENRAETSVRSVTPSRELKHSLLKQLQGKSNAGSVSIRDVSRAIDELLA